MAIQKRDILLSINTAKALGSFWSDRVLLSMKNFPTSRKLLKKFVSLSLFFFYFERFLILREFLQKNNFKQNS